MNDSDTLHYLYGLHRFGIKMGLESIRRLCRDLNNPQDRYPCIHIAGTNGKGSTAAVLASILQEAGYRVGLYTSPHLQRFNERIQINGATIPENRVAALTEHLRRELKSGGDYPVTFFEFTTALAFVHFAEEAVDIAIFEVGMGGRLDATNVVHPWISLLTNVDYDHQEHLGGSLKEIALEKCAVIKEKVPVVTGETGEETRSLIEKTCREKSAPLFRVGQDFQCIEEEIGLQKMTFRFRFRGKTSDTIYRSSLTGRHQLMNIGMALTAAELLREKGILLTAETISRGISKAGWPGRLETVHSHPLILLDGAHNTGGVRVLCDFLRETVRPEMRFGKFLLIFGVLKDKDAKEMLRRLLPFSDQIILTRPATERAQDPDALKSLLISMGKAALSVTQSVEEGLTEALHIAGPDDFILITGSLYTVGEARRILQNMKIMPDVRTETEV